MKPECIICPPGVVMEMTERLPNVKIRGLIHRRRRFKCPICEYRTTIYADQGCSEKDPMDAINEIREAQEAEKEKRSLDGLDHPDEKL